jgi:hypothetical protein
MYSLLNKEEFLYEEFLKNESPNKDLKFFYKFQEKKNEQHDFLANLRNKSKLNKIKKTKEKKEKKINLNKNFIKNFKFKNDIKFIKDENIRQLLFYLLRLEFPEEEEFNSREENTMFSKRNETEFIISGMYKNHVINEKYLSFKCKKKKLKKN